jgi:hypothetical protein
MAGEMSDFASNQPKGNRIELSGIMTQTPQAV